MTIEINRMLEEQMVRIVWDTYPNDNVPQKLLLINTYDQNEYSIELGYNYSVVKYRFGMYLVELESVKDLPLGKYIYKVVDSDTVVNSNSCSCDCVYATGVLMVETNSSDPIIESNKTIEYEDDSDSGYITYDA